MFLINFILFTRYNDTASIVRQEGLDDFAIGTRCVCQNLVPLNLRQANDTRVSMG